jgi:hypothetical protein
MNDIKCFYSPIIINSRITEFSQDSLELIKLWKKSWSNHGWNPIVLSLEDAKKHPLYNEIDLKDYSSNLYKGSINGHEYLELCYSRWFAYGCSEGGWSDYDVMNYGFTPEHMQLITGDPEFIDVVGSCGFASIGGYNKIINRFIDVHKNDKALNRILSGFEKRPNDISDLIIHRSNDSPIKFSNRAMCSDDFISHEWRKSPLVHYHNGLWGNVNYKEQYNTRSEFINNERPV